MKNTKKGKQIIANNVQFSQAEISELEQMKENKEQFYYDENGFPKTIGFEGIMNILRAAYKYIDNADYQKSLRRFFQEKSPISWNTVLRYAHRNPKIRYALKKIQELNEIKLSEKCCSYLEDMIKWFRENKAALYVGEYFEEHREFNRKKIEDLATKFQAVKELWDEVLQIQEARLVRAILNNKHVRGATFVLKNLHNWSDKAEVEDKEVDIRIERVAVENEVKEAKEINDDNKVISIDGKTG